MQIIHDIKEIFSEEFAETSIILKKSSKITRFANAIGSFSSILTEKIISASNSQGIIVCSSDDEMACVAADLETCGIQNVYNFPSLGLSGYQTSVVQEDIIQQRLDIYYGLLQRKKMFVVTTIDALIFSTPDPSVLLNYYLTIEVDMNISIEKLCIHLISSGYTRMQDIGMPGEFTVRGDIVDIYFAIDKNPVRIEFFDETIEKIKSFSLNQNTKSDILENVIIPPYKEIVYDEQIKAKALKNFVNLDGDIGIKALIEEKIKENQQFDGEYFLLPLFYDKFSLLDFTSDCFLIIYDRDMIEKKIESIKIEYSQNFHDSFTKNRPKFEPEQLIFDLNTLYEKATNVIEFNVFNKANEKFDYSYPVQGVNAYAGSLEHFKSDMQKYLSEKYLVYIFAGTEAQAGRLKAIFADIIGYSESVSPKADAFKILPEQFSGGFVSDKLKIVVLNDFQIFGKRSKLSKHFQSRRSEQLDSFIDLKPGDYVVHIHHGIGKFTGIERVKSKEVEKDYIAVLYADDDRIFIPVEQMNFIQKYSSGDLDKPKLDKIGGKGWSKAKERVKESVNKLAQELVALYSFRLNQKGIAFMPDTPWQKEFEAKFPYDETEDQLLTIEEVKRDMESVRPMDRLICGDVGFGKTEVAIRAAFKAVMSGRQVAILVPTTILTEQHFENISERLRDYPITIEMLSRFRTTGEQKKAIAKIAAGEVDIIIGTHRLLSNDIIYKNLGLLIIDEEHRFGVKHKEKVKQIKRNLDCLSMTATPIPRTLHMSLAKIRDMSIINTPPRERLPVETYVMEFNQDILKMGIEHELSRSGQVFFLYNRVKTINEMKKYIESVVPQARIIVAHGQMNGDELEDIIHDFIHYKYDVLLTTTIIESGIDIPRVNTIFIDRADRFGLAQLYQLRGRVGRSNLKAYAYLFYNDSVSVSEDAMKKLRVISEYTELGSGFKVAMKDMEIRGAGNMLGPEQHGDILAVGFSLYCKLLTDAVKELRKKSDTPEIFDDLINDTDDEIFLDLRYNGFISDSYIVNPREKIDVYKKIAAISSDKDYERISSFLDDRYGPIPPDVEQLLNIGKIRIICRTMGISEIIEKTLTIEIKFKSSDSIRLDKLMSLIQESKGMVYLNGSKPSTIFLKLEEYVDYTIEDKIEMIKSALDKLA